MRKVIGKLVALPLVKKVTTLFVVVAMLPMLVLSASLYNQSIERHINAARENESRLLESKIAGVREKMLQVEHVMEALSNAAPVARLLSAKYENSHVQMIMDVENIYTREIPGQAASLKSTGVFITLYTTRTDVPEKFFGVLHESRLDASWLMSFIESDGIDMWGPMQRMYPGEISIYSSANPEVIPYYRKINRGQSVHLGMVLAGIRPERLMQSLAPEVNTGALVVCFENQIVFSSGDADMVGRISTDASHLEQRDDLLYLRMPIAQSPFEVLRALDYTQLQAQAGQDNLGTLLAWLLMGIVFFVLSLQVLRLTLGRISRVTRHIAEAQGSELLVPVMVDGHDEVTRLSEAYNALIVRIEKQVGELLSQEKDKRRAQILALQYQLNPHFLFNALLWLQLSLEEREEHSLSDAVASLGMLLRFNLSDKTFAKLSEEIEQLRGYVDFANMWKKNCFDFAVAWPTALAEWELPRFTLQPLVENAMQHGLINGKKLRIRVHIEQISGAVVCVVRNDGKAISAERIAEIEASFHMALPKEGLPQGIGLINLAHRLRLTYGQDAGLTISCEDGWTCCTVTIPQKGEMQ